MTFKARALMVTPLGVHFEFDGAPAIIDMAPGKTYLVTVTEDTPTMPEPPAEKPFAASVVTTQNPWIEG